MYYVSSNHFSLKLSHTHRSENKYLVPRFHNMKNQLWAVGCGLGWTVLKKVWADYEQLLGQVFSTFLGQKKKKKIENIVASALKSCIEKR